MANDFVLRMLRMHGLRTALSNNIVKSADALSEIVSHDFILLLQGARYFSRTVGNHEISTLP